MKLLFSIILICISSLAANAQSPPPFQLQGIDQYLPGSAIIGANQPKFTFLQYQFSQEPAWGQNERSSHRLIASVPFKTNNDLIWSFSTQYSSLNFENAPVFTTQNLVLSRKFEKLDTSVGVHGLRWKGYTPPCDSRWDQPRTIFLNHKKR